MTRKQFLRSLVGIGVGAAGVAAIAGCGGDDGSGPLDATVVCTTPTTTIGTNHSHPYPHRMMVTLADVDAGADKTYDIMGDSGHTHMVTVTAAQFAQIKVGQTFVMTSTAGYGHTHTVTVMCVS